MNQGAVILLAQDHARVITRQGTDVHAQFVTWGEKQTPVERATLIRQAMLVTDEAERPVVLAIPSSWCLCAMIDTQQLPRSGRRQAMLFALEEHLPLSSEDIVADFIQGKDEKYLGVASELATLQPMVEALEAAGLQVRHVVPLALLAADMVRQQHPQITGLLIAHAARNPLNSPSSPGEELSTSTATNEDSASLGEVRMQFDWCTYDGEILTGWRWLADDDQAARQVLTQALGEAANQGTSGEAKLAIMGWAGAKLPAALTLPEDQTAKPVDLSKLATDEALLTHSQALLSGEKVPLADLRKDALAAPDHQGMQQRSMLMLAAAVMLFLVSLSGVMLWRSQQYQQLAQATVKEQVEVFKAALPDQRPPVGNIRGRFISEHRKLAGLSGQAEQGQLQGSTTSALVHLQEILGRVPRDLRVRILELSIEPELVRVDGETRTHSDAERLTAVIRQSGFYDVEPPRTQSLREEGVSFSFTAKPRSVSLSQSQRGNP